MPGNDVDDRMHNFFEQSSLSQDQRHNQTVEGNWPVFNNNQWGGNERQIGGPLNSTPKNYNLQQSDAERGQASQFSLGPHGLNFQQSNLRTEFVKNPTQLQQLNFGGFMPSSQVVHSRQNEANFLGVETEPDRHNLTSRDMSILESQQRSGSQNSNSASIGGSESPMNFNFLGGQQMSGQQQGMRQSFPQQHSSISDAHLMQQQAILTQMQETQRQHQQQQFVAMQRNAMSQRSNFPTQMDGQHFHTVNGNNFVHNSSNFPWQSHVMAGNTNWPQRGTSDVQGCSNRLMVSPEQGQALHLMGLIPQQSSQSLYGVPVSDSCSANPFSCSNADKPEVPQQSAPASFFSGIQDASLPEKLGMQDGGLVSRSGSESEAKTTFEHSSSQGFLNDVNPVNFNHKQLRNETISEGEREDPACGSELLPEKSGTPSTSSQAAVGLDPTEEKILFGNDESIWEAFGGPSLGGTGDGSQLEGPDLFNGLPSGQSGTWSALMQSAVAETSSGDVGIQEEWSRLDSQKSRPQSGNQHLSVFHENEKQTVWVDNSQIASFEPRTSTNDINQASYPSTTGLPQLSPKQAAEVHIPQEGMSWLDCSQSKQHDEQNKALENATSKADNVFWNSQQSKFPHHEQHTRHIHMDAATMRFQSLPPSSFRMGSPRVDSLEEGVTCNVKSNTESMELRKSLNSTLKSGRDQYNLNKGPPVLESSVVVSDEGTARMNEGENVNRRQISTDTHPSSTPYHAHAGGLRENLWSDAGDRYSLPVGNEKSTDQAGQKAPATRKFQYHPMGDLDMDLKSSYVPKQVLHPQPTSQHLPSGVKGQDTQPRFFGQLSSNSTDMEGRLSEVHGTVKMSHGAPASGIHPGYFPNTSVPFVRSGDISSSNQHGSSSENMLELLHKVDQFMDQNMASTGPVELGQSHSSTSHGFSLQLAPPSQWAAPSDVHFSSQISSRPIDSPSLHHMTSDKEDKAHPWLTAVSSASGLPLSNLPSHMQSGNNRPGTVSTKDADQSAPFSSGSYLRNPRYNQDMTASSGNIVNSHSAAQSFESHAHQDHHTSDSQDQASQSVSNSHNNILSGRHINQHVMPGMSRKDNISPLGANQLNQQHLWSAQDHSASDLRSSQFPPNGSLEIGFLAHHKKDEQDGSMISSEGIVGGNEQQGKESLSTGKTESESLEESTMRHPSDAFPSNSSASQKDEESHHSLNSKTDTHLSYTLMHQMQAGRSRVEDPTQRESKRLKGQDFGPDTQAAQPLSDGMINMVSDVSISQTSNSSRDARKPSVSPQSAHVKAFQFPHGSVVSHDTPFGHNDAQKLTAGNGMNRAAHVGISPQMAPSWFEHYGTFKNGQLLTAHNMQRVPVTKSVEPLFINEKSPYNLVTHSTVKQENAVYESGLIGKTQTISSFMPTEHDSSALVPYVSMPSLASLRPKKRKTATSDLLPWNKEIAQGLKSLQDMSSAEIDWARTSNRLFENVERETDPSHDLLPIVRPKRRLILTTQLMQLVFHPPSAVVFRLGASSNHKIIMYALARLALGDACSLISCSKGDLPIHRESGSMSGKVHTSERLCEQYFTKVVEDLSNRSKILESDLVRLDKSASILDFRLDCQDMERFSVINRFAKFHGRAQVDGAATSFSSNAPSLAHRPCLQRYVSAHPMPRTIPENVQCLSL